MPPKPLGLRKDVRWVVISIVPDICLTPLGSTFVPVPYTIVAKGEWSASLESSVRLNKQAVFTELSILKTCTGDEAGTGGGVFSGTTCGMCEPIEASSTVRAREKRIIRDQMLFWMNNKNTVGICIFEPPPSAAVTSDRADMSAGASGSGGGTATADNCASGPGNAAPKPDESVMDIFRRECSENTPGQMACSVMHCSNNCTITRMGPGGLMSGSQIYAPEAFVLSQAGSLVIEGGQALQCAANSLLHGKVSPVCHSAGQPDDILRSNPLGALLGYIARNNPSLDGFSCEQLCEAALGGFDSCDPDLIEAPGGTHAPGPMAEGSILQDIMLKTHEIGANVMESAGSALGTMAERGVPLFP